VRGDATINESDLDDDDNWLSIAAVDTEILLAEAANEWPSFSFVRRNERPSKIRHVMEAAAP
jgi:hypothetical protein